MSEKWCYSFDGEHFDSGVFHSKADALNAAVLEAKELERGKFFIGKSTEVFPSGLNIDSIIEYVAENTRASSCGSEYGEDYLCDVSAEHMNELEENLNNILFDWIYKYGYKPNWFEVADVEEIFLK